MEKHSLFTPKPVWFQTKLHQTGQNIFYFGTVSHIFQLRYVVFTHHGSLNVPIEHHPTIRYMVYNGYYKVMSNIPKMGHLPTPAHSQISQTVPNFASNGWYRPSPTMRRSLVSPQGDLGLSRNWGLWRPQKWS